jgi:hypothetical protein
MTLTAGRLARGAAEGAGEAWWTLLETLELSNMCAPSGLCSRFRLFAQKRS